MSGKKLYVGGLPYSVSDTQLEEIFASHGTVESARVITDKMTGRSRGFGFVEMSDQSGAETAIEAMNGKSYEGRTLTVNEAKDRAPKDSGSSFGRNRRW